MYTACEKRREVTQVTIWQEDAKYAYGGDVTELVPPDGEELEGVYEDARDGDVPKGEDDDSIHSNLRKR